MAHSFHPHPVMAAAKIILYVLFLTVLLVLGRNMFQDLLIQFLAIIWLGGAFFVGLGFIMAKFQVITLDENTISYSTGILATKRVTLPYARITETSYAQGILERILGVGTVSIDTAGGSDVAIRVGNVRYSDIKKLLQEIGEKTGKDSGT